MKQHCVLAVDIGGTSIKAGLVSAKGKVLREAFGPTEAGKSAKRVVGNILSVSDKVMERKITGIGIGCPGPLDIARGTLHNPHRFPKMVNFNIKKALEKGFCRRLGPGVRIALDNDANCFALGEFAYGAARGRRNVLALTLGTGLGCGLIIDGKLHRGATGMGAEIALNKYKDGKLEDYLSGNGLLKKYRMLGGKKYASAKQIGQNAKNDSLCRKAFAEFGKELGEGVAPLVNLLDPEMIVLGGSVANEYNYFIKDFGRTLRKNIHFLPAKRIKIAKSRLMHRAALLGAAALAMQEAKK